MLGLPEGRFCYTGEHRFREGYVRADTMAAHHEAKLELLEIAAQFEPVLEDHPFWQTTKGISFYEDYTSETTKLKHLHNHKDWIYYEED